MFRGERPNDRRNALEGFDSESESDSTMEDQLEAVLRELVGVDLGDAERLRDTVWKVTRIASHCEESAWENERLRSTGFFEFLLRVASSSEIDVGTRCGAFAAASYVVDESNALLSLECGALNAALGLLGMCPPGEGNMVHLIRFIQKAAMKMEMRDEILRCCPFDDIVAIALREQQCSPRNWRVMVELFKFLCFFPVDEEIAHKMMSFFGKAYKKCWVVKAPSAVDGVGGFGDISVEFLTSTVLYLASQGHHKVVASDVHWCDAYVLLIDQGSCKTVENTLNVLNVLVDMVENFECRCYGGLLAKLKSIDHDVVASTFRLMIMMMRKCESTILVFWRARLISELQTFFEDQNFGNIMHGLQFVKFLLTIPRIEIANRLIDLVLPVLPWEAIDSDVTIATVLVKILGRIITVIDDPERLAIVKSQYSAIHEPLQSMCPKSTELSELVQVVEGWMSIYDT